MTTQALNAIVHSRHDGICTIGIGRRGLVGIQTERIRTIMCIGSTIISRRDIRTALALHITYRPAIDAVFEILCVRNSLYIASGAEVDRLSPLTGLGLRAYSSHLYLICSIRSQIGQGIRHRGRCGCYCPIFISGSFVAYSPSRLTGTGYAGKLSTIGGDIRYRNIGRTQAVRDEVNHQVVHIERTVTARCRCLRIDCSKQYNVLTLTGVVSKRNFVLLIRGSLYDYILYQRKGAHIGGIGQRTYIQVVVIRSRSTILTGIEAQSVGTDSFCTEIHHGQHGISAIRIGGRRI